MIKRVLPILLAPLLLAGCGTTITNLSSLHHVRNANNLYPVDVALSSRQQSLRWSSIEPYVVVGAEFYPMRPTLGMTNRWEGLVPVPPGTNSVLYHYKFDFKYNAFGAPKADSAISPDYRLQIQDR